jgi:hypothetical protein
MTGRIRHDLTMKIDEARDVLLEKCSAVLKSD